MASCRYHWRRERDSNPRYGFPYSGFQDRPFQPLTHPSARANKPILVYTPPLRSGSLRNQVKRAGVKLHRLGEMGKEICQAVVPGVGVIFVCDSLVLQLVMQQGRAFFETVVVVLSAVEVDRQLPQREGFVFRQTKWTIFVPVGDVDRVAKDRAEHATLSLIHI